MCVCVCVCVCDTPRLTWREGERDRCSERERAVERSDPEPVKAAVCLDRLYSVRYAYMLTSPHSSAFGGT